jgi:hypothetical protein
MKRPAFPMTSMEEKQDFTTVPKKCTRPALFLVFAADSAKN